MTLDSCKKKIERYLKKENVQPLIVNVNNELDLENLVSYFNIDGNFIVRASDFCKKDELPQLEMLQSEISSKVKNYFVLGVTTFLKFYGEETVKNFISEVLYMSIEGHLVLITYQCESMLFFSDKRLSKNICLVEGKNRVLPKLIFVPKSEFVPSNSCSVCGINNISNEIEFTSNEEIFVITSKRSSMYLNSLFYINDMDSPYEIVVKRDNELSLLDDALGNPEQWNYLLSLYTMGESFSEICNIKFGNCQCLDIVMPNYCNYDNNEKWLFFIALKMYGSKNNTYLDLVAKSCTSFLKFERQVYRNILSINYNDSDFTTLYKQRKILLNDLKNPNEEVIDFCKVIAQKGKNAIYYLTDNTQYEKEHILFYLDKYYQNSGKNEIQDILRNIYPDLFSYLKDYKFEIPLLYEYFSLYTHSKVINKILPELYQLVLEQATSRDYNLLEPRTVLVDKIDKENSKLYFMDAMGVEYLSYILDKCREKNLFANINICCANLPTITSKNKEFVAEFKRCGCIVNCEQELDRIKHHGVNDFDYSKNKYPYYLIRELQILDETLNKINLDLQGKYDKIFMIADHGASRLAVINESENIWEMKSKGEHSGRCCPKNETDICSDYVTEENGYWVLANYDRFKGGRKANVEVHGGATLEEVVVPVIEITRSIDDIEVSIVEKVIYISYKKRASIKLFSKTKLHSVTVKIEDQYFKAEEQENNTYIVNMPSIRKAKIYYVDVFDNDNLIATGLSFEVKKEGSRERKLL